MVIFQIQFKIYWIEIDLSKSVTVDASTAVPGSNIIL